jgi:hypothetical protein
MNIGNNFNTTTSVIDIITLEFGSKNNPNIQVTSFILIFLTRMVPHVSGIVRCNSF